jgi:hypothetical protein
VLGIFDNADPDDPVIAVGDELLGSTVGSLILGHEGLNDLGEIAFIAGLENGTQAVVRATPIPEPATALPLLVCAALGLCRRRRRSRNR